jgi:hypothetical protein
MHLAALLTGAVTWDPFIRGILIVIVAVLVLPGSVYLLLATNTGVKLGLLIALAALFGWISMMAGIWSIFGIGDQGRVNSWTVKEIVVGNNLSEQNTLSALHDFPQGWQVLPSTRFADPQAAADKVLAPNSFPVPEGQSPPKSPINFTSPFKSTADYITIAGYEKGHIQGSDIPRRCSVIQFWNCFGHGSEPGELFYIGRHKFYQPFRPPHYVVLTVQAVRPTLATGGAPPKPVPDDTQVPVHIVLVRDLGSVRQPSLVISVAAGLIFLVICDVLHRRDKAIWATKAAAEERATV